MKLIESVDELKLAKALVRTNRLGKPQCRACNGKGYLNKHTPLPQLKQLRKNLFILQTTFCDGTGCSNESYQKTLRD